MKTNLITIRTGYFILHFIILLRRLSKKIVFFTFHISYNICTDFKFEKNFLLFDSLIEFITCFVHYTLRVKMFIQTFFAILQLCSPMYILYFVYKKF